MWKTLLYQNHYEFTEHIKKLSYACQVLLVGSSIELNQQFGTRKT